MVTAAIRPAVAPNKDDDRRRTRSEEHTSELQSQSNLVCRLLLEKKNNKHRHRRSHLDPFVIFLGLIPSYLDLLQAVQRSYEPRSLYSKLLGQKATAHILGLWLHC